MKQVKSSWTVAILIVGGFFIAYYFYDRNELANRVADTLADALAGSKYASLRVRSVSGIECQHIRSGTLERHQSCTGTAEFSDGTRSKICIKRTEFLIKTNRNRGTNYNSYRTSSTVYEKTSTRITVSLCGLDAGIKSTRTFYE